MTAIKRWNRGPNWNWIVEIRVRNLYHVILQLSSAKIDSDIELLLVSVSKIRKPIAELEYGVFQI